MESLIAARRLIENKRRFDWPEDNQATPKPTPVMHAAAYAADMREAFPLAAEHEYADFAYRTAGAGHGAVLLAHD